MAYPTTSQIGDMTNVSLGQIAQILFSKGFTSQMNRTFREYENILMSMKQQQSTTEREYRFLLLTALGVNAVQYQNQGVTDVPFPTGDLSDTQEVTAIMKKLQVTVELDRNVWERVKLAQFKYVDNPLALEVMNKMDAAKRIQARALFGDGSGCIGIVSAVSVADSTMTITLDTGDTSVGGGNTNWFHKNEKIAFCTTGGVGKNAGSGKDVTYLKVTYTDRKSRKVYATAGAGTLDAVGDVAATHLVYPVSVLTYDTGAGKYLGPDLTGSPDWAKVSQVMAGFESLTANDGRKVFDVIMSGQLGGSRFDFGGGIFDTNAIEESMNETEQNVGQGKYRYDQLIMPYNAYSALLEGKEADRRFISVEDSVRGGRKFIYQYGDQALDCVKSYFCPFNRIYSIPKPASGEMGETGYAVEYRGTDFRDVTAGGQKEFLKLSGGQYVNSVQSFLEAYTVLVAKQPAAVNVIHNFTMV